MPAAPGALGPDVGPVVLRGCPVRQRAGITSLVLGKGKLRRVEAHTGS